MITFAYRFAGKNFPPKRLIVFTCILFIVFILLMVSKKQNHKKNKYTAFYQYAQKRVQWNLKSASLIIKPITQYNYKERIVTI